MGPEVRGDIGGYRAYCDVTSLQGFLQERLSQPFFSRREYHRSVDEDRLIL